MGGTKVAEDTSIGASDTTVSFDCGATSTATLQDKIKYSGTVQVKLYDSYGNYSSEAGNMLSVDYTSQPAPPQASKLFFNGAEKKVYFEADINGSPNDGGTDTTRKLTLYMRVTRGVQVAVYKYNSGFANNLAGSFAFSVGAGVDKFTRISGDDLDSTFPAASDAIEYAVTDSYGNISTYVADGSIPTAPVVSTAGLDNRDGKINIGGTAITSLAVNTAIYVYYDNDGVGSSLILHNYTVSNISHDGTNTSYNATEKAAWASIAAGKNLGYAIKDTTSGNVSKLTYDGTIPAAPDVTNIGYSRASQKSTVSAAGITANTSTSAILSMWQVDDANNATPAARGTKTGVNLSTLTSDLITAQTIANPKYIAYTITDENGNTSTFANDGQVPVAPVGANITWSDAVSKFKIRNGNVGSADTQLRIYRENIGLYTYLGRAVTLSNADLKGIYGVSEEFAARKTDNTAITVYNNDPVNDKVAYTLVNDNGNESAYDDGGLVPAKPDVTKLAYSKAAKKTIVSAEVVSVDADPGCILYCYQADDASGSGLISKGLKSGVDLTAHFGDLEANQDIAEDKFILYTFKNLAGNTSTYASDGKVPVAPTQAAVSASTFSNASGDIGIKETAFTSLTANTIINVYEDDNGTYDAVNSIKKNWTASADNSGINVTKSATI
ncbi:MAG TPA: hypothetical protein PKW98_15505, partial [Candidatus Wallbacteria bacterium]|nr:hypothetical protein [Candidatus Wallbacteria bacterium]